MRQRAATKNRGPLFIATGCCGSLSLDRVLTRRHDEHSLVTWISLLTRNRRFTYIIHSCTIFSTMLQYILARIYRRYCTLLRYLTDGGDYDVASAYDLGCALREHHVDSRSGVCFIWCIIQCWRNDPLDRLVGSGVSRCGGTRANRRHREKDAAIYLVLTHSHIALDRGLFYCAPSAINDQSDFNARFDPWRHEFLR